MLAEEFFDIATKRLKALYDEDEARAIVYWLIEDILLIKRAHLRLISKELSPTEEMKLESVMQRLEANEPVQYILGYSYFMDMPFKVNGSVLIPRQETEELVSWILEDAEKVKPMKSLLDICTGSGCIGIALKVKLPELSVSALDFSEEALVLAEKNARSLHADISFFRCDVLSKEGMETLVKHDASVWVCNPPYIRELEKKEMHKNVLWFEPGSALFVSDDDPLIFYRTVMFAFEQNPQAKILYFEISEYQGQPLMQLANGRFRQAEIRKDSHGKDRMMRIEK